MQDQITASHTQPFASETKLPGRVVQWSGSWGFIEIADGRRAYVHNSMCGGNRLLEGQAVSANIVADPTHPGKWQARDVDRVASYDETGRVAGVVTQWSGSFGFIQFSDGRRAYVHQSALVGGNAAEGDTVVGHILDDPRNPGKFQANNVERITLSPGATAASTAPGALASDLCMVAAPVASAEGRVEGKVTLWNGSSGYIQFSDGRRAIVETANVVGHALSEEDSVLGFVAEDPRNPGKWQALQVDRLLPAHASPLGVASGRVDGVVSHWNDRGFGFLALGDGRRAFVLSTACEGVLLHQGAMVSATLEPDLYNEGKWLARQVRAAATSVADGQAAAMHSPPARGSSTAQQKSGTVTEWNSRGYGFALFQDGTRAYVHTSACNGEHLLQGETITADIVPDPRTPGKWQATNVHRGARAASAPAVATDAAGLLGGAAGASLDSGALLGVAHVLPQQPTSQSAVPTQQPLGNKTGTVTEWNSRGFGFLACEDGTRAYVHYTQCSGEHLQQGEVVSADIVPDPRTPGKWKAMNVQRHVAAATEPPEKVPRFL